MSVTGALNGFRLHYLILDPNDTKGLRYGM